MASLKNKKVLVCVVMGILSIAGMYAEFSECLGRNSFKPIAELIMTCAMFALVFYYAVSNFKVPHGNLLKYLFLAFSFMVFFGLVNNDIAVTSTYRKFDYINQLFRGIVVIFSAYISGRLDRIKENTVILVINSVILLGTSIMNIVVSGASGIVSLLFLSSFFILWVDLAIAYLFRYYGHKEAGLADK